MKIWPNLDQQTDQWFRVRAGRPTASQFSRIVTATGADSSQWWDYATELVAETIRPDMMDKANLGSGFTGNRHTDRGNELEPEAREEFASRVLGDQSKLEIQQVGFVTRDDGIVGCSPDGMIYSKRSDGARVPIAGLEIKCPEAGKHSKDFLRGELPSAHMQQVHGSMAVTGLRWWYFMSYCPGIEPLILRVERSEYTEKVADALDRFLIFYGAHRTEILPKLLGKKEVAA